MVFDSGLVRFYLQWSLELYPDLWLRRMQKPHVQKHLVENARAAIVRGLLTLTVTSMAARSRGAYQALRKRYANILRVAAALEIHGFVVVVPERL